MIQGYERRQLSSGFTAYAHTIDRVQSAHPASKNANPGYSTANRDNRATMVKMANATSDSDTMLVNGAGSLNKKRSTTGTLYGMVPKNNRQGGLVKGLTNTTLKFDSGRNEEDVYNAEMNHKRQVKSGLDI